MCDCHVTVAFKNLVFKGIPLQMWCDCREMCDCRVTVALKILVLKGIPL